MSLIDKINEEIVTAMKSGDREAATTFRGIKSDLKYYQIEKKLEKLSDEDLIAVIMVSAKKRKDSITQFKAGGRDDLVAKETRELELLKPFLPEELSPEKIEELVTAAIEESGAANPSEMGKVMKVLMPQVKGRADGKLVQQIVLKALTPQK